jgi:hypothetical protein
MTRATMRIAGVNERGEVRIVDDEGRLAAYGELRLVDADITGVEPGDRCALEVVINWTPRLPDPDDLDIDWDRLLG